MQLPKRVVRILHSGAYGRQAASLLADAAAADRIGKERSSMLRPMLYAEDQELQSDFEREDIARVLADETSIL